MLENGASEARAECLSPRHRATTAHLPPQRTPELQVPACPPLEVSSCQPWFGKGHCLPKVKPRTFGQGALGTGVYKGEPKHYRATFATKPPRLQQPSPKSWLHVCRAGAKCVGAQNGHREKERDDLQWSGTLRKQAISESMAPKQPPASPQSSGLLTPTYMGVIFRAWCHK